MDKGPERARSTLRQRWRDAVRDSTNPTIDAHTIAVAMALDRHMNAAGNTHTGVRALAAIARVSKNTVTDRIGRLEAAGLLEVDRPEQGGSSSYQAVITDPNCPTLWDTPTPVDNPKVSHPVGRYRKGTVPPDAPKVSHPVNKVSHPVGLIPYEPVEKTRKHSTSANGQHPRDTATAPTTTEPAPLADTPTPNTPPSRYPAEFEAWWTLYPRKAAKHAAFKAWRTARAHATWQQLTNGLRSAITAWQTEKRRTQYIPNPATWLNDRRWEDEPPPPEPTTRTRPKSADTLDRVFAQLEAEKP